MLSAMMIKTKLDAGGTSTKQGFYDYILLAIQFMAPAIMIYSFFSKGKAVVKKVAKSVSGRRKKKYEDDEVEIELGITNFQQESGMQLSKFKRGSGLTVFSGGGEGPMHQDNNYLSKAASFKRLGKQGDRVTGPRRKKDKKPKNINVGASKNANKRRDQFKKTTSSVQSSFSENEHVWIEHKCTTGVHAGMSFYSQPSTGNTSWERPEGVEIRLGDEYIPPPQTLPPTVRQSMIPPPQTPPPAVRPSMIPPPPRSNQPAAPKLLNFSGASKQESEMAPQPPTQPSMIPPSQTQPLTPSTSWTKHWSKDHNEFYYLNKDGESQWERPKGYVEE